MRSEVGIVPLYVCKYTYYTSILSRFQCLFLLIENTTLNYSKYRRLHSWYGKRLYCQIDNHQEINLLLILTKKESQCYLMFTLSILNKQTESSDVHLQHGQSGWLQCPIFKSDNGNFTHKIILQSDIIQYEYLLKIT